MAPLHSLSYSAPHHSLHCRQHPWFAESPKPALAAALPKFPSISGGMDGGVAEQSEEHARDRAADVVTVDGAGSSSVTDTGTDGAGTASANEKSSTAGLVIIPTPPESWRGMFSL